MGKAQEKKGSVGKRIKNGKMGEDGGNQQKMRRN
jgi:hypothetical protein